MGFSVEFNMGTHRVFRLVTPDGFLKHIVGIVVKATESELSEEDCLSMVAVHLPLRKHKRERKTSSLGAHLSLTLRPQVKETRM